MKHIKLYNESDSTDSISYEYITPSDMNNWIINHSAINLTESNRKIFSEIFGVSFLIEYTGVGGLCFKYLVTEASSDITIRVIGFDDNWWIIIIKTKDDFKYNGESQVRYVTSRYLCDNMDGVRQLGIKIKCYGI